MSSSLSDSGQTSLVWLEEVLPNVEHFPDTTIGDEEYILSNEFMSAMVLFLNLAFECVLVSAGM